MGAHPRPRALQNRPQARRRRRPFGGRISHALDRFRWRAAAAGTKEIAEGNVKGRGDFYMYCRQNGLWPKEVVGHDPAKEPRAFDRFCPVRNVTKDYPPTLLLHGDNDTDVPHQQSVDMAAELKRVGVVHEFLSIKGGGHGFDGKGMKDANV